MPRAIDNFPFCSQTAKYVWASRPAYLDIAGAAPPSIDALLGELDTALDALRADATDPSWVAGTFVRVRKLLEELRQTPGMAEAAATPIMSAFTDAMNTTTPKARPELPGSRMLVRAVSRISEAIVREAEVASSPTPGLSRAMWALARVAPSGGATLPNEKSLTDAWDEATGDLARFVRDNPQDPFSQGIVAMRAALSDLDRTSKPTEGDQDAFAAAMVATARASQQMGDGLASRPVPAVRAALASHLASAFDRSSRRVQEVQLPMRRGAVLRNPSTSIGAHRTSVTNRWEQTFSVEDWEPPTRDMEGI